MGEVANAVRTGAGARATGAPRLPGHAAVSGGGSGIGAAIARRLSAEGGRVTLVGRRAARLEAVAAELPGEAFAAPADVCEEAALAAAVAAGREALGAPSILVAAAGVAEARPFRETDAARLGRRFAVDAALRGYACAAACAASKHAVRGLVRSLALAVAGRGVTVNAVCRGFADTEMTEASVARIVARTGRSPAEARAALAGTNPMVRLVRPEEVADAVAWLAGPGACAVTGAAVPVAGGEIA